MGKYYCKHCKFKGEYSKAIECPWCGKGLLENERSAGELLDDVNDLLTE